MARAGSADLPDGESEIFFASGIDRKMPDGQIRCWIPIHAISITRGSVMQSDPLMSVLICQGLFWASCALCRMIGTAFAPRRRCTAGASQNRPTQRLPMANSYPIETLRDALAINRLRIATLIRDLSRLVEILTADIEHEETRSGTRNLADLNYPVLARTLRARRDNLGATIVSLEVTLQGTSKGPEKALEDATRFPRRAINRPINPVITGHQLSMDVRNNSSER